MLLEQRLSALLQLHLHSPLNTWLQRIERRQLQEDTRNIWVLEFGATYTRCFTVIPQMIFQELVLQFYSLPWCWCRIPVVSMSVCLWAFTPRGTWIWRIMHSDSSSTQRFPSLCYQRLPPWANIGVKINSSRSSDPYIQCGAVITRSIFSWILEKTSHSSPVRARCGVSFVDPASDRYFATVPVVIYAISYNIGPRYNGTRLYMLQ